MLPRGVPHTIMMDLKRVGPSNEHRNNSGHAGFGRRVGGHCVQHARGPRPCRLCSLPSPQSCIFFGRSTSNSAGTSLPFPIPLTIDAMLREFCRSQSALSALHHKSTKAPSGVNPLMAPPLNPRCSRNRRVQFPPQACSFDNFLMPSPCGLLWRRILIGLSYFPVCAHASLFASVEMQGCRSEGASACKAVHRHANVLRSVWAHLSNAKPCSGTLASLFVCAAWFSSCCCTASLGKVHRSSTSKGAPRAGALCPGGAKQSSTSAHGIRSSTVAALFPESRSER